MFSVVCALAPTGAAYIRVAKGTWQGIAVPGPWTPVPRPSSPLAAYSHTETDMQHTRYSSNTTYTQCHKTHATSRMQLHIGVPAATATLWCTHASIVLLRCRLRSSLKRARATVEPPESGCAGRGSGKFRDADPGNLECRQLNACQIS